jgi:hypothetical protein
MEMALVRMADAGTSTFGWIIALPDDELAVAQSGWLRRDFQVTRRVARDLISFGGRRSAR